MNVLIQITGWILCVAVLVSTIPAIAALKRKRLPEDPPQDLVPPETPEGQTRRPLVSVIVPARNEQQQIREALTSLLKTEGLDFEIIAINDRSSDKTGELMEQVAQQDNRVRVIHIQSLPLGWLGKNHAMSVGARQASGQLLLFTDGDILFQPRTLAAAVTYFQREKLNHLTLLPKMLPGSLIENVVTTFFGLAFATGMQLHLIRTGWPFSYAGVGAFNMIDAGFYRSIGGHEQIRFDVLDDVKLGKLVKQRGGQSDFLLADQWLAVRWQPSLWGVVTGLEKNGFASLNYSVRALLMVTILGLLNFVAPVIMPFFLPWNVSAGYVATVVAWHVVYAWLIWPVPASKRLIPFFLAGPLLMAFAYWRSALITLKQGGVRWRDCFYTLKELRGGLLR